MATDLPCTGGNFALIISRLACPSTACRAIMHPPGDRGRHSMARIETQDRDLSALRSAEKELAAGEKLTWADRPRPGALARRNLPRLLVGIPMTLVTGLFVRGQFNRVLKGHTGYDAFTLIWCSIILAMSLWLLGMPLWAAVLACGLYYAITDRRLVIVRAFPFKRAISFSPHEIETVEVGERLDGSGNIVFSNDRQMVRDGMRMRVSFRIDYCTGFFGVRDVRRVEAAVRDFARKSAPST